MPIYRIALPRHIPPGAESPFSEADMADKVKKGFYLVTIGHCFECRMTVNGVQSVRACITQACNGDVLESQGENRGEGRDDF